MNVLITGGAGFIGSHLADIFIAEGYSVTVIDNLSTGSFRNIEHLKNNPKFRHIIGDICEDDQTLRVLIDEADLIYHLAASVGVQLIMDKPLHSIHNNLVGAEKVLQYASLKNKRVFIASTSEVYGKTEKIPFEEDQDVVLGPSVKYRWSYSCAKMMDEFMALAYYNERKLPVTVIRFFNTVGPRQSGRYGMVIPRFVRAALEGSTLKVYGRGDQVRCFTHVKDSVHYLFHLAMTERAHGKVINIGNPNPISIDELASIVIRQADSSSKIVHVPFDQVFEKGFEDMKIRVPSVERLQSIIGGGNWIGFRSLVDTIDETIAYERNKCESTVQQSVGHP